MTAKNNVADVGVRLVVDSNAKHVTDEMHRGLTNIQGHANRAATGVTSRMGGMMRGAGGMLMMGASLASTAALAAGGAIIGMGVKAAHAFQEADNDIRAIAGSLMIVDRNANSFDALHGLGEDIKSDMEQVGIAAGVGSDKTVEAFNNILEHGGKTVEQTEELVEKMAFAGKAIPGGLGAVTGAMEQIQLGMARAKNPIIGMISATGMLKGSAKDVALQMQKMPIEKQMALAEKAIARMSDRMKDSPLTLSQMATGIGIVTSNTFEAMGKPIVRALEPVFGKVRSLFTDNQDTIYGAAEAIGDQIARAAEIAGPVFDEIVSAVQESWGTIQEMSDEVSGPFREAFEYLYDNKEAFARTIGDAFKLMIKAAGVFVSAMTAVRDIVFSALKMVAKSGLLGDDVAQYVADEEQGSTMKSMRGAISEKGGISNDEFEKYKAEIIASAQSVGASVPDALKNFEDSYRRAMDDHVSVMDQVAGARDAAMEDDTAKFAQMYNLARNADDKAAKEYVAKFLEGNLALQNAIAKEGPEIFKGGFDDFIKTLRGMGDKDIADALKKSAAPKLGISSKGNIVQNFNGPIHVKQDFRDQDPDRIMVMMKKDFARQGVNRLQARTGGVFGF